MTTTQTLHADVPDTAHGKRLEAEAHIREAGRHQALALNLLSWATLQERDEAALANNKERV